MVQQAQISRATLAKPEARFFDSAYTEMDPRDRAKARPEDDGEVITTRRLTVTIERWPIAGRFALSRGAKTEAEVVLAEITEGARRGRGECVPYPRYGETPASVAAAVQALAPAIAGGLDRKALQAALPPGAARNALDCALLDLEAKISGRPAHEILGLPPPRAVTTAFTLSLDTPDAMARAALAAGPRPLLKLKLGPDDALASIRAVHDAAPSAALIVDANEAWSLAQLATLAPALGALGVALIEQPLAAADDAALQGFSCPIPLCADESFHTEADLPRIAARYQAVNIKLDKAGGITAAAALLAEARTRGLSVMVGCMVATSLAMAPAMLIASGADYVDLDGPLLLARDRDDPIRYEGSLMAPPSPTLWG
jgi:L-alanine-DL-glutamate epimerase-like enolase superfamily enzyme